MPGSHLVAGCRRFLRWLLILYFFIYITVFTCDILRHKEIKGIKEIKEIKEICGFRDCFGMPLVCATKKSYQGLCLPSMWETTKEARAKLGQEQSRNLRIITINPAVTCKRSCIGIV